MVAFITFALLPLLTGLTVAAPTVTRICQADSPYAPLVDDCRGALNNITKTYGTLGMVKVNGRFQSCEVIFTNNTCRIDLCAFPSQGLATANVVEAVGDLLGNCQGAGKQKVGGYDIIRNTNVTIGILGTTTPFQTTCTGKGPSKADCAAALNSISKSAPVKQPKSLGCSIVARQGSCAINYCDTEGGQVNGTVFRAYADSLISTCQDSNNVKEGWIDISPSRRIGVFNNPETSPSPVASAATCLKYNTTAASGGGGALQSDCEAAYKTLLNGTFDNSPIAPFDAESQCSNLFATGTCGFKICGAPGTKALLKDVAAAYQSINKTCRASDGTLGGTVTISNTSNKLKFAIVSRKIPKNIFCNPSPNNSPKVETCKTMLENINQTGIYYQRQGPAIDQGCSLVLSYKECKLNFCSSQTDAISGKDLYYAANSIFSTCPAGDYVSGVYQINPFTKVSIYDPPDDPSSDIACQSGTWTDNPPNSPSYWETCYQENSKRNFIGDPVATGLEIACDDGPKAQTCQAMLGDMTTITKTYGFNVGLEIGVETQSGINAGASIGYSYSWSIATSKVNMATSQVQPGNSAYLQWFPFLHESCGALTSYYVSCGADGCQGNSDDDGTLNDPNVCNRVPITYQNGSSWGGLQLCYVKGPLAGQGCKGEGLALPSQLM